MIKAAIVGISGLNLIEREAALLRTHPPAGIILFARNVSDPKQLADLMAELRAVLPPTAVLMVDQEGGRVARLRPPHWRAHPAAGAIGALFASNERAGMRAAWLTGALIGVDCRAAGFDVVCAPVLDLRLPAGHGVIGDRAYSEDAAVIARLARAAAAGLLAASVQPVGKHAPGHGRAKLDSHLALPEVRDNDLDADIVPFAANADLPWMMTAHILYPQWDARRPATLSPTIIADIIRTRIGFHGVLVSDDLAMHALSGTPAERALGALQAGCDIALYCPGDLAGTSAVLDAVPALTDAASARLAAAAALALSRHSALNADELAAERSALIH
jgi:beta-N-acetylhexosaminidase